MKRAWLGFGQAVAALAAVTAVTASGKQEPDQWPGGGGEADPEEMRLEVLRTMFAQINQIPAGGQKE